ncbi:bifunctional lysine-specific demethylase and histidyl-hydroxylase NO66 [Drosophila takahashii]|uniref:bifunctional lysine-specific demethylase and histidyl-hydroxylase NO66 n=1 Tax=Drosophila takahashii TaxID=29030 RepID=UPI001CF873BD|nr:bifunctional lysine-specific demethylase and histidyl-hydroxylase NO66 [Drosophila takahashii]XP_017002372.2 bifunctional lysine-specific demethylase and histidyl-hydroxylase NO66 [Drosophila takahashii]XP_017002373.2 bifunctional lysine-specific demethylase and histidyl-hydroxylase NO66 [Drosophila takahashii]
MPKAAPSSAAEAQGARKKHKSPTNGTAKAKKTAKSDLNMADMDMLLNPSANLTKEQKERRQALEDYVTSEFERATENGSGDSNQSSPEVEARSMKGKSKAARPTDRKRRQQQQQQEEEEEDSPPADSNNNRKAAKGAAKRRSQGLEHTSPVQVNGGAALACPLVRKSLPAASGPAKSCPLPEKRKSQPPQKQDNPVQIKQEQPEPEDEQQETPALPQEAHNTDSIEEGRRILQWILNPVKTEHFFADFWEKNACVVQRKNPKYYSDLISFKMIDEMLIRHRLDFTINLDVTSYKNGRRETLNPEGRAMPPVVWGLYSEGCSIRILNPSTYLPGLRQVCSIMQEYFHCLVGANVYLTPPNSQGFAPHYDDIEAFVVQVEGRKRWRLYEPPREADRLARISSGNYDQGQLGEPLLDEVLEAGDLLYFPRGTVHQAITEEGQHSLHITLSVYQQQAYANLVEKLMPIVIKRAVENRMALRRGLPLHTFHVLGEAQRSNKSKQRREMVERVQQLVATALVPSEKEIDAAVDQLAKKFQHEALPPTILPEEKLRTVFGSRSSTDEQGNCICDYEFDEETSVRLLRANILRLVTEDDGSVRIYHHVDNALEYCKYEPIFMEILPEEAAAVSLLISAYPYYLTIAQLPLETTARKVEVVTALWERGLLMTEKPFN